jgi:hypothetical protein
MADTSIFGSIPPYGVPIREALASGDSGRIRQVSDAARQWLKDNPGHELQGEVHAALREVDEHLGRNR